jgi:hypothetical protein
MVRGRKCGRLGRVAVFGSLLALAGCSSRTANSEMTGEVAEPIQECRDYADALRKCFTSVGPEGARLAESHAATARAELEQTPTDEGARAAMRERCLSGTKHVLAACR